MPSRSLSRSTAVRPCAFCFAKLVQTLHGIFSLSSVQNLINTYGAQQQFANLQTRRGLKPKCVPQLFLESRLN